MKGIGGPAKGRGNGNARKMLDTSHEKQVERAKKRQRMKPEARTALEKRAHEIMDETGVGFMTAKRRAWREMNPEYADEEPMSRLEAAEYAQTRLGPAIDALVKRLHTTTSDSAAASIFRELRELGFGKDPQNLELTGMDGGGINLVQRIELVPVEPERGDEA